VVVAGYKLQLLLLLLLPLLLQGAAAAVWEAGAAEFQNVCGATS